MLKKQQANANLLLSMGTSEQFLGSYLHLGSTSQTIKLKEKELVAGPESNQAMDGMDIPGDACYSHHHKLAAAW